MLIPLRLRQTIRLYLRERIFLIALVTILFAMGIIFGVLAAGMLNKDQAHDLVYYVNQGLHNEPDFNNRNYTNQIIFANIQTVFFLFFMGISVIGVPLALLLIFTRGFILGFSTGFLIQTLGFKGLLLTLTGVLPHNLIMIPALFLMVIAIIDCAAALTKIRFTKQPVSIRSELVKCAVITIVVLVMAVLGGVVQGQVTTMVTSWLAKLI